MRILFTCYPGLGHLHPMLPLARAALRAGHEVAFATGPDVAPRAGSYGFTAWPVGLTSSETVERYLAKHPESNALREHTERWGADLVIHDQSELAAPIVAAALATPTLVHSWGPMMRRRGGCATRSPRCRRPTSRWPR